MPEIPEYGFIDVDKIELDYDNPRIARVLEMYENKEDISAEQISLALGTDGGDASHTTFTSLKESIRTNGGIIHPIIVNKVDSKYTVIEGNTRVQIYKDFMGKSISGNWDKIMAVIYSDLSDEKAHAIRLQAHLVGPRDWDPYSKAKYLNKLHNQDLLPFSQIVDYCGGDNTKTRKYIEGYDLMEKSYREQLDSDDEFDPEKFSAYIEYQNGKVKKAIADNGFTVDDFSRWIITEKIPQLNKIRQLPAVLSNKNAKEAFVKEGIDEAIKILNTNSATTTTQLEGASLYQLAVEIAKRLGSVSYAMMRNYRNSPSYVDKKAAIFEALAQLSEFCDDINGDD